MPAGTVSPQDASGFVSLADALPDILLEIRYFSTYNFIGERIDGYTAPRALMTREAAQALSRVSQAAIARGYRLKVLTLTALKRRWITLSAGLRI